MSAEAIQEWMPKRLYAYGPACFCGETSLTTLPFNQIKGDSCVGESFGGVYLVQQPPTESIHSNDVLNQ